jgi:hypothetical protein
MRDPRPTSGTLAIPGAAIEAVFGTALLASEQRQAAVA